MQWKSREAIASFLSRPKSTRAKSVMGAFGAAVIIMIMVGRGADEATPQPSSPTASPALSVTLTVPQRVEWPQGLTAFGNVVPWQEAVIGAEIGDARLTDVRVNVGDGVKKGQVLAAIAPDKVKAELGQAKALAAEAKAMLAEAEANAERARQIKASGALSAQQINQYLTAEQTAIARVNAAKAKLEVDELRFSKTRVVAPNNGVISVRVATVGSLVQPGQELFRLIIDNRLEWRAEVTAEELSRLKPGMTAMVVTAGGTTVEGKVRVVAPTVDPKTRNAIVYVDLPVGCPARAGTFVRGELALGTEPALAVPQSSVVVRDGFAYLFTVHESTAGQFAAKQTKVSVGRRVGDQIEITSNLPVGAQIAASGAGFLGDGDVVRVVAEPAETTAAK